MTKLIFSKKKYYKNMGIKTKMAWAEEIDGKSAYFEDSEGSGMCCDYLVVRDWCNEEK